MLRAISFASEPELQNIATDKSLGKQVSCKKVAYLLILEFKNLVFELNLIIYSDPALATLG